MKLNIDSDIFEVGNFSVMDKLIDNMLHTCNAVIKAYGSPTNYKY